MALNVVIGCLTVPLTRQHHSCVSAATRASNAASSRASPNPTSEPSDKKSTTSNRASSAASPNAAIASGTVVPCRATACRGDPGNTSATAAAVAGSISGRYPGSDAARDGAGVRRVRTSSSSRGANESTATGPSAAPHAFDESESWSRRASLAARNEARLWRKVRSRTGGSSFSSSKTRKTWSSGQRNGIWASPFVQLEKR